MGRLYTSIHSCTMHNVKIRTCKQIIHDHIKVPVCVCLFACIHVYVCLFEWLHVCEQDGWFKARGTVPQSKRKKIESHLSVASKSLLSLLST